MAFFAIALNIAVYAAFFVLMAIIAVIDLRTLRIPNPLAGAVVGLWAARLAFAIVLFDASWLTPGWCAHGWPDASLSDASWQTPASWQSILAQSITGSMVLGGGSLALALAFEAITHRPSMGGGDIKLLFAVGLWLGVERGLVCLFVACLVSLALALALPRLGWKPPLDDEETQADDAIQAAVPFGPAIAVGAVVAIFL